MEQFVSYLGHVRHSASEVKNTLVEILNSQTRSDRWWEFLQQYSVLSSQLESLYELLHNEKAHIYQEIMKGRVVQPRSHEFNPVWTGTKVTFEMEQEAVETLKKYIDGEVALLRKQAVLMGEDAAQDGSRSVNTWVRQVYDEESLEDRIDSYNHVCSSLETLCKTKLKVVEQSAKEKAPPLPPGKFSHMEFSGPDRDSTKARILPMDTDREVTELLKTVYQGVRLRN